MDVWTQVRHITVRRTDGSRQDGTSSAEREHVFWLTRFLIPLANLQRVAFIPSSTSRAAPRSLLICSAKDQASPAVQLQPSAPRHERRSVVVSFRESESERLRGPPVAREESFCSNLVENVSAHRGSLYTSKVMVFPCSTWLPSWFMPRSQ